MGWGIYLKLGSFPRKSSYRPFGIKPSASEILAESATAKIGFVFTGWCRRSDRPEAAGPIFSFFSPICREAVDAD